MRRITIWLTTTVTVIALVISYQASASGADGGHGAGDRSGPGMAGDHPPK